MGQALQPSIKQIKDIRYKLLQPALTSHFLADIAFPNSDSFQKNVLSSNGIPGSIRETLSLSCSEASLPGSSLATHELNSDFTGITQKHAYRRLYDDRADFTFYVDQDYSQIRLFEAWTRFIAGEQIAFGERSNLFVRANYPINYKSGAIYITKFERNYGTNETAKTLKVSFINAFPIAVNSIPVSYDASTLLKTTVSFAYDRYVLDNTVTTSDLGSSGTPGIPQNPFEIAQQNLASNSFTDSRYPQANYGGITYA